MLILRTGTKLTQEDDKKQRQEQSTRTRVFLRSSRNFFRHQFSTGKLFILKI